MPMPVTELSNKIDRLKVEDECRRLYRDPIFYDLQTAHVPDSKFWLSLAERHKWESIIELGCGTGRLGVCLARSGLRYFGVDNSRPFLEKFQEKIRNLKEEHKVKLINSNFCNLPTADDGRVCAAILPFNTLVHVYDNDDFVGMLNSIRHNIKPEGGMFAIDVFNPCLKMLSRSPSDIRVASVFQDASGIDIIVEESSNYDRSTQMNTVSWRYLRGGEVVDVVNIIQRIYWPKELEGLLKIGGMRVFDCFGDYDMSPFVSDSPKQILLCKRI